MCALLLTQPAAGTALRCMCCSETRSNSLLCDHLRVSVWKCCDCNTNALKDFSHGADILYVKSSPAIGGLNISERQILKEKKKVFAFTLGCRTVCSCLYPSCGCSSAPGHCASTKCQQSHGQNHAGRGERFPLGAPHFQQHLLKYMFYSLFILWKDFQRNLSIH